MHVQVVKGNYAFLSLLAAYARPFAVSTSCLYPWRSCTTILQATTHTPRCLLMMSAHRGLGRPRGRIQYRPCQPTGVSTSNVLTGNVLPRSRKPHRGYITQLSQLLIGSSLLEAADRALDRTRDPQDDAVPTDLKTSL